MAANVDIFRFRAQFPELKDATDADIAVAFDTATLWVDPGVYTALDYPFALLYWAAHFTVLKQMQLASVAFGGTGETDIFIRSIGFGERRVQFGQRQSGKGMQLIVGPGEDLLDQTIYGQLYLQLRSRNVIPVVVI